MLRFIKIILNIIQSDSISSGRPNLQRHSLKLFFGQQYQKISLGFSLYKNCKSDNGMLYSI